MDKFKKNISKSGKTAFLVLYSILTVLAIFILTYLLIVHYQNGECTVTFFEGCTDVNLSKYSEVAGIPLSLLGMLWLGGGLIAALLKLKLLKSRILTWLLVINGGFSVIFSIYLVLVQAFFIKAWCEYCLLSDIFILAGFVCSLFILLIENKRNLSKRNKSLKKNLGEAEKQSKDEEDTHKIELKEVKLEE